ncbi:50S ribosomal protein L19e [Candidatus Halobonum tyrrellensis]|uniref:Large ribosomal subunit protein eL19 n=1 Tax=Candidatus Halobonum tyrrellensis G22 TaxID=1324957 RepID=V4HE18_9EURY|nr:50S ribosomal protein L19e [Candidatus Halobonum tyrrellensis]ESP88910.1 50S ribosomal protein L19e [Candidatus Halobonum tyrrellensis G22]
MTDLSAQRRLAADVLDVGESRVWLNPEAQDELADAITREDIREQVEQGNVREEDAKSNSRGRARERDEKRSYGHRTGPGSRKGKAGGRQDTKSDWVARIRAQRARLKELRDDGPLDRSQYRELYDKASGGEFEDVRRLETYAETNYDITLEDDD